jgi:hypothetical protein
VKFNVADLWRERRVDQVTSASFILVRDQSRNVPISHIGMDADEFLITRFFNRNRRSNSMRFVIVGSRKLLREFLGSLAQTGLVTDSGSGFSMSPSPD